MQAHTDVAEALDRLRELAGVRRPDDEVLGEFLALYYSELPVEDVDDRKIDDIYSVGVAHFDLGRRRFPGSPVVRVMSPDRERDGWSTPHSVVLMVTDDMPFLVDTMRMLLERRGLDIHLLVHPMLLVERDSANEMRRVALCSDRLDGEADEPRSSRHGLRSRSIGSTTIWRPSWSSNWRWRSPRFAVWSTTSGACATACSAWRTSTRR